MSAQIDQPESWAISHEFKTKYGHTSYFDCAETGDGTWYLSLDGESVRTSILEVKILARKFAELYERIEAWENEEAERRLATGRTR